MIEEPRIDVVIIDDDRIFSDCFGGYLETVGKVVKKYSHPDLFLQDKEGGMFSQSNTKVCVTSSTRNSTSGVDIIMELHRLGFRRLYLFSCSNYRLGDFPYYLKVLRKTDAASIIEEIAYAA